MCVCVCLCVCVCVCMCVCVYVSYAYTMPRELVGFKAHIHNNANIHRNRFRGTIIGENSLTHYPAKHRQEEDFISVNVQILYM